MAITNKEGKMSQLWRVAALVVPPFHRLSSTGELDAGTHMETAYT